MNQKLILGAFIFSIMGLIFLGLTIAANHLGFGLTLSGYIFILFILGVIFYVLGLNRYG